MKIRDVLVEHSKYFVQGSSKPDRKKNINLGKVRLLD